MIARPATPDDLRHVCRNMRAHNARELLATQFHDYPDLLADEVLSRDHLRIALSALLADDGVPTAFVGVWLLSPGVAGVQLVATDGWPLIARAATRYLRRRFMPAALAGVRRAECWVMRGGAFEERWLALLGFQPESVPVPRGKNGELFQLWSWSPATVDAAQAALVSHQEG